MALTSHVKTAVLALALLVALLLAPVGSAKSSSCNVVEDDLGKVNHLKVFKRTSETFTVKFSPPKGKPCLDGYSTFALPAGTDIGDDVSSKTALSAKSAQKSSGGKGSSTAPPTYLLLDGKAGPHFVTLTVDYDLENFGPLEPNTAYDIYVVAVASGDSEAYSLSVIKNVKTRK